MNESDIKKAAAKRLYETLGSQFLSRLSDIEISSLLMRYVEVLRLNVENDIRVRKILGIEERKNDNIQNGRKDISSVAEKSEAIDGEQD